MHGLDRFLQMTSIYFNHSVFLSQKRIIHLFYIVLPFDHPCIILLSLFTSFPLIGQVSHPCSMIPGAKVEYNLPDAPKADLYWLIKVIIPKLILYPLFILAETMSTASLIMPSILAKHIHSFIRLTIWFCTWTLLCCNSFLTCASLKLKLIVLVHSTSNLFVTPKYSNQYCTNSVNKAWTPVSRKFKSYSCRVRGLGW